MSKTTKAEAPATSEPLTLEAQANPSASTDSDYVASNNVSIKHDVSLAEYAADLEDKAFKLDLVVVSISHPQATDGDIYTGRFAGIKLSKGKIGNILSNGESI